tara:strand:- start:128 stop:349 length:222 start_codon:yes stop_codon:yes gene_type:complete
MAENKLGSYILNLMATIKDTETEQFVKDLAYDELKRLNSNVEEFLKANLKDDSEEAEKTEKQLLQEEAKDGKK